MTTERHPYRQALSLAIAALLAPPTTLAAQEVAPPVAQAWIDVATVSGLGMPAGLGQMASNPMAALGGLFGGKSGKGGGNAFGNTHGMSTGRWVDVTLRTRNNPNLDSAQQAVPDGFLAPALSLRSPQGAPPAPTRDDDEVRPEAPEKPRGRILMYWGCGDTIRKGQPAVLDMATANIADFGKFFVARSATQRGTHSAVGRPDWPNKEDDRMVPAQASLVGEHAFSGDGVPDGFKFRIGPQQDIMPALQLDQADKGGATELTWNALPTARAYFAAAMGGTDKEEMIIWSSSEVADAGFGLMDYQTNAAVDRWLKEKVVLAPATTRCTVPKGIFPSDGHGGGMVRLIAYGDELNLAHPPRPKDPKEKWEPVWAVKVRVKSVANGVLGMSAAEMGGMGGEVSPREVQQEERPKAPDAVDLLKGLLRR